MPNGRLKSRVYHVMCSTSSIVNLYANVSVRPPLTLKYRGQWSYLVTSKAIIRTIRIESSHFAQMQIKNRVKIYKYEATEYRHRNARNGRKKFTLSQSVSNPTDPIKIVLNSLQKYEYIWSYSETSICSSHSGFGFITKLSKPVKMQNTILFNCYA